MKSTAVSANQFIAELKLLSLDSEYWPLDEMISDHLVVAVHLVEMLENYYLRVTKLWTLL